MSEELVEKRSVQVEGRLVLPVIVTRGEDGLLVGTCPILPGCIAQGRTEADLLENMAETAIVTLENMEEEGWDIPAEYGIAEIEVPA